MRRRKGIFAFSLFASVLLFMAACGNNAPTYVLPTLAPTYTPTPEPVKDDGPTPTIAPDANNTKIIALDGEDFNQTSHFSIRGSGSISVKPVAYSGSYAFYVSGREDTWHGVSLNFSDADGNVKNVIGKKIHIAAWVYQETGAPADFSCTLQVKKPDSTSDTPESISITGVPSGTWALIEGDIPVYANITNPTVSIEMSSSKDPYYFDDIRVTYDPTSTVPANSSYNVASFDGFYFDFEDQVTHLAERGTGKPSIAAGGCEDGEYCLFVSGRTASWNGAEIDLSEYGLAGSKIWISYSAMHDGKQKTKVTCSLQQRASGATSDKYANITSTDSVLPGEWAEASGSVTIGNTAESVILYFETGGTEDFYIDNVMISSKDPSTITIGKDPQGGGSTIVDTSDVIDTTGFVTIHSLTADDRDNETQILSSRGSASPTVVGNGHSGNGFLISGRSAAWNGVGLDFKNLDNESFDVIGKQVYVSCWVYQDSGEPLDFSATLQVNKPDGTATWPERVSIEVLPSGQWTHVEGLIPVYANVKVPQINFEVPGSDTADFILDDIIIAYNPKSKVEANPDYVIAEKEAFSTVQLDFEDNNAYFVGRGNAKPSIVYGGHESDMCLAVTGRTASWHGVQADFSKYDLAGKTLDITYWVYHEYTTPLEINMTAEQNDGETTTYTPVIVGEAIEDGKWVKYNNTYTV
ncbi:MAG: carbohydrate binding domain-containing protein, partial [Lachnospiraceae bacterium]